MNSLRGVTVFNRGEHEQVVYCRDSASGLRAIVAIYSTVLGPGLGGTRFHEYASEDEALSDVLELSKAMAYKASVAGLDLGGAKAVILGDPKRDKTPELLKAYGRFVQSLAGRYYTACDVGTYVEDMDVIATECEFVTGGSVARGGAGDSSVLTAYGVFQGMRGAAEFVWGQPDLTGRRVGISGLGKTGSKLAGHLLEAGAKVVAADVDPDAVAHTREAHPDVEIVPVASLVDEPVDIYAPCALGHALDDDTVARLHAYVVCGAANNQIAHPGIETVLAERGIVYCPDYVVNAGGLIQVEDEIHGYDAARAHRRAEAIYQTTKRVLETAQAEGIPSAIAADRLAERRIAAAEPVARPYLRSPRAGDSATR